MEKKYLVFDPYGIIMGKEIISHRDDILRKNWKYLTKVQRMWKVFDAYRWSSGRYILEFATKLYIIQQSAIEFRDIVRFGVDKFDFVLNKRMLYQSKYYEKRKKNVAWDKMCITIINGVPKLLPMLRLLLLWRKKEDICNVPQRKD